MRDGSRNAPPPPAAPTKFSHDLMNLLGIALGHAELLLLDTPDDDPRSGNLRHIREACQRAIDLTRHWRESGDSGR